MQSVFLIMMPLDNITSRDISNLLITRYIHVGVATVRLITILEEAYSPLIIFHIQVWLWDMVVSCSTEVEAFGGRKLSTIDMIYLASR